MTRQHAPLLVLCLLLAARDAGAVEYNFAGSVSLNYKMLVNEVSDPKVERNLMLSGFNVNASVKAVVDVTPYLSATAKLCYGCHGLEAAYLYAELTPHSAFNIRAGRIQPAFGDFYLRHDPASHKTADNPLPYDMGHMVHGREWGYGVLPIPYVDNGAEVFGTVRPTNYLSLFYSAHLVNGWKASATASPTGTPAHDFAYQRSRFVTSTDYIVDNNRFPSVGGRLALTFARTGSMSAAVPDITLGGSALYGRYDDYDQLSYVVYGVDLYVHWWRINVRAEILRRSVDVDARLLDYPDGKTTGMMAATLMTTDCFGTTQQGRACTNKDGFYAETDFPLGGYLEGVLRVDGLRRTGPRDARANPEEAMKPPDQRLYRAPGTTVLDFDDWVMRYTVGINVIPVTGAKIKLSYEYWNFKDVPGDALRNTNTATVSRFTDEYMIHLALVASY